MVNMKLLKDCSYGKAGDLCECNEFQARALLKKGMAEHPVAEKPKEAAPAKKAPEPSVPLKEESKAEPEAPKAPESKKQKNLFRKLIGGKE